MRSSATQGANFNSNLMRSPEPTGSVRRPSSIDRAQRSVTSNNLELPYVDPQARFSISYVPGMSEHVVNTGKTLPEAQLKVVLLACEVERLNTLNYNLVKENEILKSQSRKTDREADLETKLAIVLAENEKLNQIVEELHAVYARERDTEEYERRIQELLHELDAIKGGQGQTNVSANAEHRIIIQELEREREMLKEDLGRQSRDNDALRQRLNSIQIGPAEVQLLQEQITNLKVENAKYKSELETMHLKYGGNADAFQQRLNQYEAKLRVILAENDKLNNLLVEKARELQELQARNEKLTILLSEKDRELNDAHMSKDLAIKAHGEEKAKKAALVSPGKLDRLSRDHEDAQRASAAENERLNAMVIELRTDNENLRRVTSQTNGLLDENRKLNDALLERSKELDRLNGIIYELRAENERLKQGNNLNLRLEQLTLQTNSLLEENRKLNESLADRLRENDSLRVRIHDLEVNSTAVNDLRNRLNVLNSESDRLNVIIAELRAENQKLRGTTNEAQINSLLSENKRLNDLLIEKATEIDRYRRTIAELEAFRTLNDRVLILSSENEKLTALVVDLRRQLELSGGSSSRVEALTLQLNTLLDENKRLNDGLIVRVKEIDTLKLRISELEAGSAGFRGLENKLHLLTNDNERLNASIYELRIENDKLKAELTRNDSSSTRITQLSTQLNSLLDENKRLNDLVVERTAQIDRLKRMMVELDAANNRVTVITSENERLTRTIIELRAEIEQLRHANDGVRVNQLTIQLNGLLDENKRLNDLLLERSHDVERLRKDLIDAQGASLGVSELRQRNAGLTADNQRLSAEINRLTLELASSLTSVTKIEQLTVQINSLLGENRRLNDLVVEKARENDDLRRRLLEADNSVTVIKELRDKLAMLAVDSERLNTLVLELRRENDGLRGGGARVESLTVQINGLLDENRRLNDALAVKVREVDELRIKLSQTDGSNAALAALTSDNKRLSAALEEARERYLRFERDNAQTADIRNKASILAGENDRLNVLVSEKLREIDELRKRLLEIQAHNSTDELKGKLHLITAENDRLNVLVHEKLREIDSLKAIVTQVRDENQRLHIDIQNLRLENQRLAISGQVTHADRSPTEKAKKSALPAAMTESQTKFEVAKQKAILDSEEKVRFLEGEIHRLTTLVHENERQFEFYRSRDAQFENLQRENARLNAVLAERSTTVQTDIRATLDEEYRKLLNAQIAEITARFGEERQGYDKRHTESLQRLHELQEKIQLLTSEHEKILVILEQARQEITLWRAKYDQLEKQRTDDAEKLRLDYERRIRESPTRQGMSKAVVDLEERVALLTNEKERLEGLLSKAQRDQNDFIQRESLRGQDVDELRQQFEKTRSSIIQAKEVQVKFDAERTAYETQILQLQQRVADLEAHIQLITSENERLNTLSITRLREVEDLKRQLGGEGSASTTLEINQLRSQIENYKAGQHDIQQLAIKYSAEKAADQSQIKQLKQVCENYKAEIDKLYALLDQRKSDVLALNQQYQELLQTYEKLIVETGGKTGSGSGKERVEVLEREVRDLEASRDEFRKQAQRNSVDLTRKTKDLVEKIQELDILKMKYEEAVANYQALNGRMFERLSVSERR